MECTDLLTSLGYRIRTLRTARRWSQAQLAEFAGIHPTYVSDIELGKTKANVCIFHQLAQAFGLKLPELFELPEERDEESVMLFISQVRSLDARRRKLFLTIADAMLKGMKEY